GDHENEGQQEDEDPRQPLGTGISPEPPGPIGEKGQIETRTDEAAADEQQPELPVVAHADLAALLALGRPPHRDRGDAALLMPGVAVSDDGRGKRIARREDRQRRAMRVALAMDQALADEALQRGGDDDHPGDGYAHANHAE